MGNIFEIGDRVITTKSYEIYTEGKKGKIISVPDMDTHVKYCVEFDEYLGGHDGLTMDNKGKNGHCWYISSDHLQHDEKENKPVRLRWYKHGKLEKKLITEFESFTTKK